jgi:hypothetical protein
MQKFARYAMLVLVLSFTMYGLIEARFLIKGPTITLSSPSEAGESTAAIILLSGRTERTKELRANGRIVPIDSDGNFVDHITVPLGASTLTLVATDSRDNSATLVRSLYRSNR